MEGDPIAGRVSKAFYKSKSELKILVSWKTRCFGFTESIIIYKKKCLFSIYFFADQGVVNKFFYKRNNFFYLFSSKTKIQFHPPKKFFRAIVFFFMILLKQTVLYEKRIIFSSHVITISNFQESFIVLILRNSVH